MDATSTLPPNSCVVHWPGYAGYRLGDELPRAIVMVGPEAGGSDDCLKALLEGRRLGPENGGLPPIKGLKSYLLALLYQKYLGVHYQNIPDLIDCI